MKRNKAVVVLSGGQDSVTCLYYALKNFEEVHAITFFYNQKHYVELQCAENICKKENVKHLVINLHFLPEVIESAMVTGGDTSKLNNKGLPSSFVPNRNALFLTLAHGYAQKIEAGNVITGVCQTDFSGYPDCRNDFVQHLCSTLNEGSDSKILFHTPLMWLNKAETFALAGQLGKLDEVIKESHTCYEGNREKFNEWGYGCGVCPACELRKKGYEQYRSMTVEMDV